jgi:hypothetical protein
MRRMQRLWKSVIEGLQGAADGVFVGTVEAVGTVVQYSQRLLLQSRRLGAHVGAVIVGNPIYGTLPVFHFGPDPRIGRFKLLVGAPLGGLGGDLSVLDNCILHWLDVALLHQLRLGRNDYSLGTTAAA